MKKLWSLLLKSKNKRRDIKAYLVGNLRYWAWYATFMGDSYFFRKLFIREHIRQQIEHRIYKWMDRDCYSNGECKICGCTTTALQMANKACDKPCYPEMMDKVSWGKFKEGFTHYSVGYSWILLKDLTLFKNKLNSDV